jgi:hypothetical protein
MAPVAEQGHANILPDPPISPGPVSVTMPPRLLVGAGAAVCGPISRDIQRIPAASKGSELRDRSGIGDITAAEWRLAIGLISDFMS